MCHKIVKIDNLIIAFNRVSFVLHTNDLERFNFKVVFDTPDNKPPAQLKFIVKVLKFC